jgi:ATP-dependent helicase YprA (DUF1998 family)
MKVMQKHIEFFQEEKYRDLEYGTIYYVAGTTTPHMNLEAKHSSRAFTKLINLNPEYWVNCKVVYLDSQNDLFISSEKATFYSALIPTADNLSQGYSFLVAELDECDKEVLFTAIDKYFSSLLKMLDEVLDEGEYSQNHILFPEIIEFYEDELQVGCIALAEGATPICGLPSRERPKSVRRNALSRLEITPATYQVKLPDYGKEVHFTPQVKALYVLFLKHPEGIIMKHIGDYKQEYKSLYLHFTNRSDNNWLSSFVDKLLDACNRNALDVKKSQCNDALHRVIKEDELFQYYEIEAKRGRPHRIKLNRELVILPESLL